MKRWRILLACLLAVLTVGGVLYVNDYYLAGEAAQTALESPLAEQNKDYVLFRPEEEAEAGLIFYPGAKVEYTAYAPLMEELAQENILCILVKMPANLAFFGINKAEAMQEAFPELTEWYIGGHSLGGAAAGVYAAKHADQLDGLILLASYVTSDLSETDLSVLSVCGTEDGVINWDNYEKYADNLPMQSTEVMLQGGCHSQFGDYGEQKGDGTPTITCEEQTRQTADAILTLIQP